MRQSGNFKCVLYSATRSEIDLIDRCWEVIEIQTEQVMTSDEFVTVGDL